MEKHSGHYRFGLMPRPIRLRQFLLLCTIGMLGGFDHMLVECRHRELDNAQIQLGQKLNSQSSSVPNDDGMFVDRVIIFLFQDIHLMF